MVLNMKPVLLMTALFLGLFAHAQESAKKRCGATEFDAHLRKTDADYADRLIEVENAITTQQVTGNKSAAQVVIPVVVHVIYRLPQQNISMGQIHSQIDALNEDFNKLNADVSKVPSFWQNLVADCEIEFKLADRDPDGNITDGVTRTQTTIPDIASLSGFLHYQTALGGHDPWDPDHYLNIWVCEIFEEVYGFATFPGASKTEDGVVLEFESFGTEGLAEFPSNLGRTGTHEIGHWLGLRHIWGDTFCGDDLVADTPTQEKENFGCANHHITCGNGPNGDMYMNYMDYADDRCMYFFTEGQKTRMHAVLNTSRKSLLNSPGYNSLADHESLTGKVWAYPNPSLGVVYIEYDASTSIDQLEVFDLSGKKRSVPMQLTAAAHRFEINLSGLPGGVYVVRATNEFGQWNEKVIHQ